MPFPKEFYGTHSRSQQTYTDVPTGDMDLDRAIDSDPNCFVDIATSTQPKPLKMVLSAFNARNWTPEQLASILQKLEEMIVQGFEIYAWQSPRPLKPLTKENLQDLASLELREGINPTHYEAMVGSACKQIPHTSHDDLFILDDYWIDRMISPDQQDVSTKRYLKISDLPFIKGGWDSKVGKDLSAFFRTCKPKITDIMMDEISIRAALALREYLQTELLEQIPLHKAVECLDVSSPSDAVLLKSIKVVIKIIKKWPGPSLKGFKKIKIGMNFGRSDQTPEQLGAFVAFSNKLSQVTSADFFERIMSVGNFITGKDLETLVNSSKESLEELYIMDCYNIVNAFVQLPIEALPELKKFTAKASNLSKEDMQALMLAAPKLEEMNLSGCTNIADIFFSLPKKSYDVRFPATAIFPNLKKIDLSSTDIKPIDIFLLRHVAPNLEEINVQGCLLPEVSDLFFEPNNPFPNLKKLTLSARQHKSKGEARIFFENLPKLEDLNLSQYLHTYDEPDDEPNAVLKLSPGPKGDSFFTEVPSEKLSGLKKVSMGRTYIDEVLETPWFGFWPELMKIFDSAPNLEEIDLGNHYLGPLMVSHLYNRSYEFPKLKKITQERNDSLKKCDIDRLLIMAPNLNRNELEKFLGSPQEEHPAEEKEQKTPEIEPILEFQPPPKKRPANQRKIVDANTHWNPNKKHEVNRIFYAATGNNHPDVTHYRLGSSDALEPNPSPCTVVDAFLLFNKNRDLQFGENKALAVRQKLGLRTSLINGRQSFDLDANWQSVASLSAYETMLHYKANPPDAAIEIAYSIRDNLYYIRSKKGAQRIDLDFTLEVPEEQPFRPQGKKEKEIKALVDDIFTYGVGDLSFKDPSKKRSGEAYLKEILKQRKGSCRHRAVAFKAQMQKKHSDVPTRILDSDCHSWAEIYINGHWVRCELGGYEAKLEIKETLLTKAAPESKSAQKEHEAKSEPKTEHNYEAKYENNKYLKPLRTWENRPEESKEPIDPKAYCQELLKPDLKNNKRWIKLGSDEAVDAMAIGLQKHCKSIQRPVFYIDSPADVFCSKRFLEQKGNFGCLRKGPGGALHAFLKAELSPDNPPVILINYRNFTKKQILGLHGWLDPERVADGTPIPPDALIVAVSNINSPQAYTDTDLSSRFDIKDERLIKRDSLPEFVPSLPIQDKCSTPTCRGSSATSPDPADEPRGVGAGGIINLYHGLDWKSQLLGHWTMTERGLYCEEGKLMLALAKGKTIEIQNGPWEDPEFNAFMRQACLVGEIRHQGKTFKTEGLSVLKSEGYDWLDLQKRTSIHPKTQAYDPEDILLNPSQLSQFFTSFEYQADSKTLIKTDGHLKKAKKNQRKDLSVYLTRSLSEDAWAKLLTACKEEELSLQVKLAPGISLPQMVLGQDVAVPVQEALESKSDDYRKIIQSADPEAAIAGIKAKDPDSAWIAIDVSELRPSDLLIKTRPKEQSDEQAGNLQFNQNEMALSTALKEKKNIILTGTISNALADALAPLFLERQNTLPVKLGKLMVVAKDIQALQYAPQSTLEEGYDPSLRAQRSNPVGSGSSERPLDCFAALAMTTPSDPALAMKQLNFDKKDLGEWDEQTLKNTQQKTKDFFAGRNQSIQNILFHPKHPSPCVYIAGLSGVGKSTFIDEELQKPRKLYKGEGDMAEWAAYRPEDPQSKDPIYLFIDEANLSPRQWTELEGLYLNQPPTIVVDGKLCTLTPQHKIIFAGNPLNYGDERILAPFLSRHVPVITFKPLPYCVLFERSLKPIFENTTIKADEQESICKQILAIYAFLCEQSTTDVLISPRELQSMALLTVSYCKQIEKDGVLVDREMVARHYAYKVAEGLVPADKRVLFEEAFGKTIPELKPLPLPIAAINKNPHFKATASRLGLLNSLHELLILREERQQPLNNKKQKFGGLGGMLLQGDSSVGKTSMVIALLLAHDFEEEKDYNNPSQKAKPFYRLDSNRSIEEREKLAVKACYEGAVLMVDELNTSTFMERLLNDLMMGKIPKKYKRPGEKITPGFLVIGTQNPPTMAGRGLISTAQARRWHMKEIHGYSSEELLEIIVRDKDYSDEKEREKVEAFKMVVDAFQTNVAIAKKEHYSPAPTLRDVFRITDAIKERPVKELRLAQEVPKLEQEPEQEPKQPKPKTKHSNSYFAFRILEAVAIAGAITLVVTSFALSLGLVALVAGAALGGTVLLIEFGLFCKNKCKAGLSPTLSQK